MLTSPVRFPIRFEAWYRVLSSALLIRPSDSYVDVTDGAVFARMAWAFRAHFPRSAIVSARRLEQSPLGRGVHGLAGRWLVNGSGDRVVVLDLEPKQRARVLGFSVGLRQLMVSVDEPDELVELLANR